MPKRHGRPAHWAFGKVPWRCCCCRCGHVDINDRGRVDLHTWQSAAPYHGSGSRLSVGKINLHVGHNSLQHHVKAVIVCLPYVMRLDCEDIGRQAALPDSTSLPCHHNLTQLLAPTGRVGLSVKPLMTDSIIVKHSCGSIGFTPCHNIKRQCHAWQCQEDSLLHSKKSLSRKRCATDLLCSVKNFQWINW